MVTLALHGHPFSSYTWKALIALYANATPFEFREIDPSVPKFESFTGKAHPSGQFPVLTDGETVVVETSSIVEYLAVHHPGPAPLIPADPAEAVVARMLDRVFDHYVMGNMQRVIAAYFVDKDDPGGGRSARRAVRARDRRRQGGTAQGLRLARAVAGSKRAAAACQPGDLRRGAVAVLRRLGRADPARLPAPFRVARGVARPAGSASLR